MTSSSHASRPPVAQLECVVKEYRQGTELVRAVDEVSLTVESGTFTAVVGPSGAGKSTLLYLIGGLDRPTSGRILIDASDIAEMSDRALTLFRRRRLGFVFQFFNLLPNLSVWENIALPLLLDGTAPRLAREQAAAIAARLEIEDRLNAQAALLSGGEMQRAAIARAMVCEPVLVLADEPTGNLDRRRGEEVVALLRQLVTKLGRTVVMVTHDPNVAGAAERKLEMVDGRLTALL